MNSTIQSRRICALLFGIILLAGCVDQATVTTVAQTSIEAADTLRSFYSALILQVQDARAVSVVDSALNKQPVDQKTEGLFIDIERRLDERLEMARSLSGTYQALKALSSKDEQAFATAGGALGTALQKLQPFPILGGPAIALPEAVKEAVTLAGQLIHQRDTAQALKLTAQISGKVHELFAEERSGYNGVILNRQANLVKFATNVIDLKMVQSDPLLKRVIEPYGLPNLTPVCPKDQPECTRDALVKLLGLRADQMAFVSRQAMHSMDDTFKWLVATQENVAAGRASQLNLAQQALQVTKAYLEQLNQLRTPGG